MNSAVGISLEVAEKRSFLSNETSVVLLWNFDFTRSLGLEIADDASASFLDLCAFSLDDDGELSVLRFAELDSSLWKIEKLGFLDDQV